MRKKRLHSIENLHTNGQLQIIFVLVKTKLIYAKRNQTDKLQLNDNYRNLPLLLSRERMTIG